MSNLLSYDDMVEFTGAEKPSKQIEVLESNRIRYVKRLNGSPVTTWAAVNAVLAAGASREVPADDGFNLGGQG